MSDDHGLRIGDLERAAAAERLAADAAAGRLDIDELDARLERVNAAILAGDLLAVESDLPRPVDRRPSRHRPPPVLIVLLLGAVLASLAVGHPIAPVLVVLVLLWRAGHGRGLLGGHRLQRSLP